MTLRKRIFDLVLAAILSVFLLPVIILTALAILIIDGRPILYVSERMKSPGHGFSLVKFRTMKLSELDSGVSGADKSSRITRTGSFLRKSRLDETPQLWNVLRGDMSFVGPRPPLREYVERFPAIYDRVLKSRPGITGLASVYFHAHEERLLARSNNPLQTDRIYSRYCVPRKARLDLIYQTNISLCFDIELMFKTVFRRFR
ncbi:MAG TPA: sugar transferase [Sulfitobacter pontiacus]|uniref:sugar transferase n=1 Tax=Sulfitobacter pontiacus TaxID=60137 RepID=UPI0009DF4EF3|nr:sugar transferase [Sulfitobacter pontiacus]HJO52667.1 sugar transferase [Sulfitobacter pontiacus]